MRTATITARVDPATKSAAAAIFDAFGMSLSEAISIFLHKSIQEGGLPFEVRQSRYNRSTEAAIADTKRGVGLSRSFSSVSDLMADLDADD